MKSHIVIKKGKGYKNKLIAQNVGIAVANNSFKMMLDVKMQSFMNSWDDPVLLKRAGDDMFLYFRSNPKNLEELKAIAKEAAYIEFENLKESHVGKLPVRIYSDDEIVDTITSLSTDRFLLLRSMEFYRDNEKVIDIDSKWKDLFVQQYTVAKLSDMSKIRANQIFEEKNVSEINRSTVLKNIDSFWNNVTDLKSELYSSR